MVPLLGWIEPALRTQKQSDMHQDALSKRVAFTLPPVKLASGDKVILPQLYSRPEVIADVKGKQFTGFHQLTGSCVGASTGNAIACLLAVQRFLTSGATKFFIPFWPVDYGRCRTNEGDHGQGEGAVDSVMGQTLMKEGVLDSATAGLPQFDTSDGFTLTSQLEMTYSDGTAPEVTKWASTMKQFPLQSAATVNSTDDIWNAIANGYPVLDGCSMYVGHGTVQGSGDTAACIGDYDGQGGHSTGLQGIWQHPSLGKLFLYSNQWGKDVYPEDGSGKGWCMVWMKEASVARLFQLGGDGGESMALSHQVGLPAQPDVLSWALAG